MQHAISTMELINKLREIYEQFVQLNLELLPESKLTVDERILLRTMHFCHTISQLKNLPDDNESDGDPCEV
jgi:hypothetical protein